MDLLAAAVSAIERHCGDRDARLIFLGDYVDRGPDSRQVVEYLMTAQQADRRLVCLRGNHEQMMLDAILKGGDSRWMWLDNGGEQTLRSYGAFDIEEARAKVPDEHLRWMSQLPLTSGDEHRIYVHAGILPSTPLEQQKPETLIWIRERFLRAKSRQFDRHIVHGHTPMWEGKPEMGRPELLPHRTNLDTGAYETGILSVGVFPAQMQGGPAEGIQVSSAIEDAPSIQVFAPSVARKRLW